MPTLEELEQESAWRSEQIPDGIADLKQALLDHHGWPGWYVGTIGDIRHLSGYHRSRRWIKESRWCTNRFYSVTETEGNREGGSDNNIAGIDITVSEVYARNIYTRLRTAKSAGSLPEVRQVILESNPWHVHLSIDRGAVAGSLDRLYRHIIGESNGGWKMVTVTATMPELKSGVEGPPVKTWQTLLVLRGETVSVDGQFGPKTDAATRALQQRYGAESVDGIVGPETWVIGLAGEDQT